MYNFSDLENIEHQMIQDNEISFSQQSTFVIQTHNEPHVRINNNTQTNNLDLLHLTGDFSAQRTNETQKIKKQIKRSNGGPYQCEHCQKEFSTGSALGGHKSRVHPSQSNDYKKKINTALKRAPVRERTREIQLIIFSDLFYN